MFASCQVQLQLPKSHQTGQFLSGFRQNAGLFLLFWPSRDSFVGLALSGTDVCCWIGLSTFSVLPSPHVFVQFHVFASCCFQIYFCARINSTKHTINMVMTNPLKLKCYTTFTVISYSVHIAKHSQVCNLSFTFFNHYYFTSE